MTFVIANACGNNRRQCRQYRRRLFALASRKMNDVVAGGSGSDEQPHLRQRRHRTVPPPAGGHIDDEEDIAAPDSDLEYHIKFPSSNFNYGTSSANSSANNGEEYVFVVNEERLPVILLFGWAGCQDKYLAKYSRIYEDKGLITLRYIVPIKYLLWKRYQVVYIGQKLVKLLFDLNFDGHPIIVHCFSNGGAFLYQNFSLAIENSPKAIQVKGVIFDSGPGSRKLVSLYKAISAIMGGNIFYNTTMSLFFTFFCSMIWIYEMMQKYLCGAEKYLVADPFDKLKNEKHLWPQHFIFSEADELISHKDVEHFINYRQSLGVAVSSLKYKASPHVKHYSENKESYVASVYAFLNKCLRGGDGVDDIIFDEDAAGDTKRFDLPNLSSLSSSPSPTTAATSTTSTRCSTN